MLELLLVVLNQYIHVVQNVICLVQSLALLCNFCKYFIVEETFNLCFHRVNIFFDTPLSLYLDHLGDFIFTYRPSIDLIDRFNDFFGHNFLHET
jgi:hypothetical protein